ncbi:N-acetylglucosamine kinase [Paeniglutamicibacter sp. Y32M11]|uniref:N-acetylglucosamine kinase n=1 Tax=Paeniglutamicibacter sp. Y32M11 TaxID=2853258 RepID=UPI001C52EC6A|nr:BadF/BadG/BcrA/BcrD ATPase family protein [Paeniglutamicibacter sp. Y32M11]QXQ11173.1 ATPase [Paeniglutamicibacter sp. Y32M11]
MNPADIPHHALVGLDIGGTKTHGVRWLNGQVIAEAKSGSANTQNVSLDTARENLAKVFESLGSEAIDMVIAGAGGIDTQQDAERLRDLIATHAPTAQINVVHDSRLILAAGHAATGMAVILGTGSAFWGINDEGKEARSGGWGYLLGDEASGYWMGREAVRFTLREANREQPPSLLSRLVLEANQVTRAEELIGRFHADADRRHWAQQSPLVFTANDSADPGASTIIDEAVAHVVASLGDLATILGIHGPVIIGGGLGMYQPVYQQRLRAALSSQGFENVRFLEVDPVFGVPFLASKSSP